MDKIEIEYNRQLKPLEALLSGVKQPGDFFVSGTTEIPMPRVEIKGAGSLSFPVPDVQVAAIVRQAARAPYGKGEKTIVDTAVRNVWQIAPSEVKISGKSWAANFESILSKVKEGLGCGGAVVSADFYKLLVYDRGGFFLAHRDTEKTAGMFATLVLTLPSTYRGGALRIAHAGREVTVETEATDPSELSYAAFYADCEHEVLPLREGNRVCLIYNLIQKQSKGRHKSLKAPNYEALIARAGAILDESLQSPDAPAKIAWLLDHQYSPVGLSFSALKGADAARAGVLLQAASRAQCDAYLGIVHIGETGSAEPDYALFYGSRRDRYWSDEGEEDEEDGGDDADFTVASVDDSWQHIDEWRDSGDRVVEFGSIPLASGELLPAGALDKEAPDEKRLTEASGNEGATYERSYHRAALVVWRQERSIDVLLQAGATAALPYLARLAAGGADARPKAVAAAKRILTAWKADLKRWDTYALSRDLPGPTDRIEMIEALAKLEEPRLLDRFIREVVLTSYDGPENTALIAAIDLIGAAKAGEIFSALVSAQMPRRPSECVELLLALSETPSHRFPSVAAVVVEGLDRIGVSESEEEPGYIPGWLAKEKKRPLGPQLLENLMRALQHFNGGLLDSAAEKIVARPEIFDPVTMVVPSIEQLCAGRPQKIELLESAVRHLWIGAAEFLLRRSETAPEPPSNWLLDVEIKCSCADCRELQVFARDTAARVHRFRVNQQRRRHLHSTIDRHRLDMTHETERKGSPQTLVCTKDRRTFDRRMKQYAEEIAAMRKLVKLA